MALAKQALVFPLKGLNTHYDEKNSPPGTFDLAENLYYKRVGQEGVETRKRLGTTSRTRNIIGGGTIASGKNLSAFDSQELMTDAGRLYSYSPDQGAWKNVGGASFATYTVEPLVPGNAGSRGALNAAIHGNLMCVVSSDNTPASFVSIIDIQRGVRVLNEAVLPFNAQSIMCVVACATRFLIFGWDNSTKIKGCSIQYATPTTVSGSTDVVTDVQSVGYFDVFQRPSSDTSCLLAYRSSGANKLVITTVAETTFALSNTTGNADVPDQAIAWLNWDYSDSAGYLVYTGAAVGTKLIKYTTSIASTTVVDAARAAAANLTGYRSASTNFVFLDEPVGNETIWKWTGSGSMARWQINAILATRVFANGTGFYLTIRHASSAGDATTNLVLDATAVSPPTVVATALQGANGGGTNGHLQNAPSLGTGIQAIPLHRRQPTGGAVYLRLTIGATIPQFVRFGEQLFMAGGTLRAYDGGVVCEAGFLWAPNLSTITGINGGNLTATKTYQVQAVYAWTDARGQTHRSFPSNIKSILLAGAQQSFSVVVSNYTPGDHPTVAGSLSTNVSIELYVTAGDGTTFFKPTSGGTTKINDPTTETQTITIDDTDVNINAGLKLYTTGGVLPHDSPPGCYLIEKMGDRLFLIDGDANLWPSNARVLNEGVSFSGVNAIALPHADGKPTAMAEMDGRLHIFYADAIFVLQGSGPTLSGSGQYDQPQRLTAVIGAVSQASVTKTHQGIMFKSLRGMYLLPRGGGSPVRLKSPEAYDALTITSAYDVEDLEQVRSVTAEGRTLVYHWGVVDEEGVGRWSTFTGQAAVDCFSFNNAWCYLSSDGKVHLEVAGQYADDGVAFTEAVEFAWLAVVGLFGNLLLYTIDLLAQHMASYTLNATLSYDYNPTVVDTLPPKAVTTATIGPVRLPPSRMRAQAFLLKVSETSTTEGFRLSALGVEVGPKPGFRKQAAAQYMV